MIAVSPATRMPVHFELPSELVAAEPPEARGLERDEVRLLVAHPGRLRHARFRDIGDVLEPGDLLVVNVSATLPAAVDAIRHGRGPVTVHFSTAWSAATWIVELRRPDGSGPVRDGVPGETVDLPGAARLRLIAAPVRGPHRFAVVGCGIRGMDESRLWVARVDVDGPVEAYLAAHGRPIAYGYIPDRWPLSAYQTVFAAEPGSAEMPSAGRPFTAQLVARLISRGVVVAPVLLHAGVSSLEAGEEPQAERFRVPPATAALVAHTRRQGGRVIAVGTTVTRALETVARSDGSISAGEGWTDLVLGSERPARVVDGLLTGWHAPDAPHLRLLEAVAGLSLVREAYQEALEAGYLWHEFGDSCLLLCARP